MPDPYGFIRDKLLGAGAVIPSTTGFGVADSIGAESSRVQALLEAGEPLETGLQEEISAAASVLLPIPAISRSSGGRGAIGGVGSAGRSFRPTPGTGQRALVRRSPARAADPYSGVSKKTVIGVIGTYLGIEGLETVFDLLDLLQLFGDDQSELIRAIESLAYGESEDLGDNVLSLLNQFMSPGDKDRLYQAVAPFAHGVVNTDVTSFDPVNLNPKGGISNARKTPNNRVAGKSANIQRSSSKVLHAASEKRGGQVPDSFESFFP